MNITFFTNLPGFIGPIVNHFSKDPDNQVRVWVNGDQNSFMSALQTSEIVWFDFANEMLLTAQNVYKHKSFKCIVRLHSYEAFTEMPHQVDWSKVDDLILVNDSLKDIMNITGIWNKIQKSTRVHTIPNLIDTSKFNLVDVAEKDFKKIAYLGHINYKKDPSLIIPIAEHWIEKTIHCGGEIQDLRYKIAFDQYITKSKCKNIKFEGHQNNVNEWLKDKGYILNTSLFESFNYALCEAMLCGCIPLIRNWPGAENIYPNIKRWDGLFDLYLLMDSIEDAEIATIRDIQLSNRKFVIDNYDVSVLIPKIEAVVL